MTLTKTLHNTPTLFPASLLLLALAACHPEGEDTSDTALPQTSQNLTEPGESTGQTPTTGENPDATTAPTTGDDTDPSGSSSSGGPPEPPPDVQDILSTDLELSLDDNQDEFIEHRGKATLIVATTSRTKIKLATDVLEIAEVRVNGEVVAPENNGNGITYIPINPSYETTEIFFDYGFIDHPDQGYSPNGYTLLWPYFCSNLYPCYPNPDDGSEFTLKVDGIPADKVAVYPSEIPAAAPTYMPAFAFGDYTKVDLGATSAGTKVSLWYLPGQETSAKAATARLRDVFDFYEQTYGKYLFGDEVGSVQVAWQGGGYGGMEHHPFWHLPTSAIGHEPTHVHEAAHGWFGNGVRIKCWEDFVLSEGTSEYLTARSITAVAGQAAGDAVWSYFQSRLDNVVQFDDSIAWPDGCNQLNILSAFSEVPYMKGAFFYRAVAEEVGVEQLDEALREFYAKYKGQAASMQDMLDVIFEVTNFDASDLANAWLKQLGTP